MFYSDWCGHCRAFAPLYKRLADDVKGWSPVVKVAAINCADQVNEATCRANGVQYFPFIKYFPRNSSQSFDGNKLKAFQSLAEMRDQLTKVVIDDFSVNRFPDWPDFDYLNDVTTYGHLWDGVDASAQFLAIVFESHQTSLTGAQLLLDLSKHRDRLVARRSLRTNHLTDILHLTDFPSIAIFKKGETQPVHVSEIRRMLLSEVEAFLGTPTKSVSNSIIQMHSRRVNRTAQCEENPDECRPLYFVSEVDMLKAMRYALYRETARNGTPLHGNNLTALYQFLNALSDHFPTTTSPDGGHNESTLDRSTRAVRVFMRLREFLEKRGLDKSIPVEDWQKEFLDAESDSGSPFPTTAEWDHCKGSTPQYRGYTCGLWTTFHTISVTAYRQGANSADFHPLPILHAIRDWVGNFFGCLHCREHFLRMATKSFKIEDNVKTREDVFLYLWEAHNRVNKRLMGRDTEDPKFPKYLFPANFLCQNCSGNETSRENLKDFLLSYYSEIKPYKGKNLLENLTRN
ncbi:unnamed protein product, partial [Mesorhabditis belari]|uniref:Sulfhydryl oxidase n=1 Tax=Mesorhabditis belari TaxID=2138241 RepID=A0AAF3F7R3_9BILA